MKEVTTKDGSITFFNDNANDYYHSQSGAREESFEKHVKALNVVSNSVIFDMFFGLGYNSAAAIDTVKGDLVIYCFENDKEILSKILEIDAEFESWGVIQEFVRGFIENDVKVYSSGGVKLIMLFGDAREKIQTINIKADFVFFDPFSPSKVPKLWDVDFLKDIRSKMNPGAKLSTYSCAKIVKGNFNLAGFNVCDGPVVGRRSPSTIAVNNE
jgi:tRNA U34 5-methylaminomethyl-2-thiouridine-forming methyltransferase MnmC